MKIIKKWETNYKRGFYVMLLLFSLLIVIYIGGAMNVVAENSNGGKMPVLSKYSYETDFHYTYQSKDEVNYWFFTDFIDMGDSAWSVGDFIMWFSYGLMLSIFIMASSRALGVFRRVEV